MIGRFGLFFACGWCAIAVGLLEKQVRGGEFGYLIGHDDPVYKVAYTPDGRFIVSASFDHTVRVWDRENQRAVVTWEDHSSLVLALAVSRDGRQVASGGLDKQVLVYDLPSVVPRGTFALSRAANAASLSSDGALVAIGQSDEGVQLRRTADGQLVHAWPTDRAEVTAVDFQSDGSKVWAATADGKIRSWNASDGSLAREYDVATTARGLVVSPDGTHLALVENDGRLSTYLTEPPPPLVVRDEAVITGVASLPGGKRFVMGNEAGRLRVVQVSDGSDALAVDCGSPVRAIGLRGDGAELAVACASGEIQFRNLTDLAVTAKFETGSDSIARVAYHPAGEQLAVGLHDGTVRLWKLPIAPPASTTLAGNGPRPLAVSNDRTQWATVDTDGNVRVVDAAEGTELHAVVLPSASAAAAFSDDGSRLLIAGNEPRIRMLHLASGGTLSIETPGVSTTHVAADSAGEHVLAGGADGTVRIWRLDDGALVGELPHAGESLVDLIAPPEGDAAISVTNTSARRWRLSDARPIWATSLAEGVRAVDLSPAGDGLVVASADGYLRWYDAADGALRAEHAAHEGSIAAVCWSGDGRWLVSAGDDLRLRLWDTATARLAMQWTLSTTPTQLAFLPDGSSVVSVSSDGTRHVWPISLQRILGGGAQRMKTLAYSPDGTTLVTTGSDALLRVWSLADASESRTFDLGSGVVSCAAFRPDGACVAAANEAGLVRIWNLADGAVQAEWSIDEGIASLRYSLDGGQLLVAGNSGSMRVCEANSGSELRRLDAHEGSVHGVLLVDRDDWLSHSEHTVRLDRWITEQAVPADQSAAHMVAYDPEGRWLFTSAEDGSIVQWNAADLAELRRFSAFDSPVARMDVAGGMLAAVDQGGTVRIWQVRTGRLVSEWTSEPGTSNLRLSPGGERLFIVGPARRLETFRVRDGRAMFVSQPLSSDATGIALAGDGLSLVTWSADASMHHWSGLYAGPKFKFAGHESQVHALAFDADGSQLASGGADQKVKLWSLAEGKHQFDCVGHIGPVYGLAYHPTESQLASCGVELAIRLWNPGDGQPAGEQTAAIDAGLNSIMYSPDGSSLLTAGIAQTWQVRPVAGEGDPRTYAGHDDPIYRAVYNPSGTRVATIDHAGSLYLWDASSGEPLHHEQLPVRAAYDVAYSPDGHQLAIATVDHRIFLFDVPEAAR